MYRSLFCIIMHFVSNPPPSRLFFEKKGLTPVAYCSVARIFRTLQLLTALRFGSNWSLRICGSSRSHVGRRRRNMKRRKSSDGGGDVRRRGCASGRSRRRFADAQPSCSLESYEELSTTASLALRGIPL